MVMDDLDLFRFEPGHPNTTTTPDDNPLSSSHSQSQSRSQSQLQDQPETHLAQHHPNHRHPLVDSRPQLQPRPQPRPDQQHHHQGTNQLLQQAIGRRPSNAEWTLCATQNATSCLYPPNHPQLQPQLQSHPQQPVPRGQRKPPPTSRTHNTLQQPLRWIQTYPNIAGLPPGQSQVQGLPDGIYPSAHPNYHGQEPHACTLPPTRVPASRRGGRNSTRGGGTTHGRALQSASPSLRTPGSYNPPPFVTQAAMANRPPKRSAPDDPGTVDNANKVNVNGSGRGGATRAATPSRAKQPRTAQQSPDEFSASIKAKFNTHSRTGQACDRCKVRKIRCDQNAGGCSHCTNLGLDCNVTDRVTGRTERRGYREQLEREKEEMKAQREEMLAHIRYIEGFLPQNNLQIRRWGANGAQPSPGTKGEGDSHTVSPNTASQPETAEDQPSASPQGEHQRLIELIRPHLRPGSSPHHSDLAVTDTPLLTLDGGTRMTMLGMTIDTANFVDLDVDEPAAGVDLHQPLYNKSVTAFLRSTMGKNPVVIPDLPDRDQIFEFSGFYFVALWPFLPVLHQPSYYQLLNRLYDEPEFQPSVGELVIVHIVIATIYFHYGVRNNDPDQRETYNTKSNQHYHFALSKFPELLVSPKLSAIQALTLVAVHARSFAKPGSGVWACTMAMQRAIELKMHLRMGNPGDPTNLENELRKRCWWSILIIAVNINGRLGRPMPLALEDFDVDLPEPIDDELLTDEGVDTSRTMDCPYEIGIATFKIVGLYITMYTHVLSPRRNAQSALDLVTVLEQQLRIWEDELPDRLKLDHPSASDSIFQALFAKAFALELRLCLRHPTVSAARDKKSRSENMRIAEDVAREMLALLQRIQNFMALDTTWLSISTYAVCMLTTLVGHWQRRHTMTSEELTELRNDMQGWLSIFNGLPPLKLRGQPVIDAFREVIDRTITSIKGDMGTTPGNNSLPAAKVEPGLPGNVQGGNHEAPPPNVTALNGSSQDLQSRNFGYPDMTYTPAAYHPEATSLYFGGSTAAAAPNFSDNSNRLVAFANTADHMGGSDLVWGRDTFHAWQAAMADSQETYSANALLNLGAGDGSSRTPITTSGIPDNAAPAMTDMSGVSTAQWPHIIFDGSAPST